MIYTENKKSVKIILICGEKTVIKIKHLQKIKMIYPEKKKSVEIFLICGKKEENTTTQHA